MNLSKVNLNLLVALDVLLTERHVTKAGKKLYLSQSAMSNILKQLRETFKDELFVRGAKSSMIPTPRALQLAQPVHEILMHAAELFSDRHAFNPATLEHTFTLGMSDYAAFILLPPLMKYLRKNAPQVNLIIKHVNYLGEKDILAMETNRLDLIIGIYHDVPPRLNRQILFYDRAMLVGARDNPLMQRPLTLKQFAAAKHVVVLFFEDILQTRSDQLIAQAGLTRRAVVTMSHNLPAIYLLPDTDLVSLMLSKVAEKFCKSLSLKCQPAPIENATTEISQVWHARNESDPAQQWLRKVVHQVANEI